VEGWGYGKIILLGEHAVVYGAQALTVALGQGVRAQLSQAADGRGARLEVPSLNFTADLFASAPSTPPAASRLPQAAEHTLRKLGLEAAGLQVRLNLDLPAAAGLGASAACAVALVRAASRWRQSATIPDLGDAAVAELANEAETLTHGRASGIDSTVATYGGALRFVRPPGQAPSWTPLRAPRPLAVAIGLSGQAGDTQTQVAKVNALYRADPPTYQALFDRIDRLTEWGAAAFLEGDIGALGGCMNRNHQLLRQLEVSTPMLDRMVERALHLGAAGAKLCGAGGGGAMLALAATTRQAQAIAEGLKGLGCVAWATQLGG
jgi:hydroxymethylglutaryl-CoA reductase